MARKDLLKGLLDAAPPTINPATINPATINPAPPPPRANPMYARGAIGAVNRSIAELKTRAVIDIDPHLIDAGGVQDRLESDSADDAALGRSIAEYGQQVPVLVRPHPTQAGRYQIVYGRRRVLALRDLGRPVKALVRDLDDQELVLAQGQENTARRDLSFIEKVNFARQMVAAGYKRKIVCDALTIDKTLISRMISIAERVPTGIIEAIGAAPGIGRDRWNALADRLDAADIPTETACGMIALSTRADTSDARFEALYATLNQPARQPGKADPASLSHPLTDHQGRNIGSVRRHKTDVVVTLTAPASAGFEHWLIPQIADLHRRWTENREGEGEGQG